jgi:hypothetical protein
MTLAIFRLTTSEKGEENVCRRRLIAKKGKILQQHHHHKNEQREGDEGNELMENQ